MTHGVLSSAWLWLALVGSAGMASAAGTPGCSHCAEWNEDQKPFRIYGDTYYVGTHGLGAILVVSPEGSVLIDGDLPESVPKIVENIRSLGFRVQDVKLILNTHVHFDHAGGIAELQRTSGARVAASEASAKVLREGGVGNDDPQRGSIPGIAAVPNVETVKDGESLRVGPIALTARLTPGHTPGGTSWTWKSCEGGRCLDVVYADSLTPVAAKGFLFSDISHAGVLAGFAKSYAALKSLPCDVLVTPHPEVSDLWTRLARREQGERDALIHASACVRLADSSMKQLEARIDAERSGRVR